MSKDTYIGFDTEALEKFKNLCGELKSLCESFPTCAGCPCAKKHIGCSLRGKTPRDVKL